MNNRIRRFATLSAVLLASVAALLLLGALDGPASASPQACDPILYVDYNGGCNGETPCYSTIQAAVDAACVGREIRVRQGTYTGVQVRNSVTQVVYITRSVTIRGGYSLADWDSPHPDTQPTIIDAQGQGRVFYVLGPSYSNRITPTLQGLRLTNGSITAADGGGLYSEYADLVISGCHVYSNTVSGPGQNGGGIHLWQTYSSALTGNHVYLNTASGSGGGINLSGPYDSIVAHNNIYSNTAEGWAGGGLYVSGGARVEFTDNHIHHNSADSSGGVHFSHCDDATLEDNDIHDNVAEDGDGGGVLFRYGDRARITGNDIYQNEALGAWHDGAGILVHDSLDVELTGNNVYSNTAGGSAGGIRADNCDNINLARNHVYGNSSTYFGGGIELGNSSNAEVRDNDIHHNSGPIYGGGLYIGGSPYTIVEDNWIHNNQADSSGGGVHLTSNSHYSILSSNRVHNNTCDIIGGGLYLTGSSNLFLSGNQIQDNAADDNGGGVYVATCPALTLASNMVVDNQTIGGDGPGVYLSRSSGYLYHTTIANNTGGYGQGVYATMTTTIQLNNSIIVSHEIGLQTGPTSTASLNYTLWGAPGSNTADTSGSGIATFNNLTGDPDFEAPLSGDYHITYNSPAKDAATDIGVQTDIDGDSRTINSPPDIGADEYACHVRLNDSPTPYASVQAAIDAATGGDTVRVAGVCRTLERNASEWQAAYIAKNLTLRGGYSTDFATWDPVQYPTTLDAGGRGRGVYHFGSGTTRLESLRLVNGLDGFGSGVVVNMGNIVISGCHILNNTASLIGGGIYIAAPNSATVVNTVIADNQVTSVTGWGAGIFAISGPLDIFHTTLARNSGGDGAGVTAYNGVVAMTNTILVDHSVGITTNFTSTVNLESTLWGSGDWANDLDMGGPGSFTSANDYWIEPSFVDADEGDYHLTIDSPAVDIGHATSVNRDIDGHGRPVGPAPDLGADEVPLFLFLPLVTRSY
jgi:hypothetical protein